MGLQLIIYITDQFFFSFLCFRSSSYVRLTIYGGRHQHLFGNFGLTPPAALRKFFISCCPSISFGSLTFLFLVLLTSLRGCGSTNLDMHSSSFTSGFFQALVLTVSNSSFSSRLPGSKFITPSSSLSLFFRSPRLLPCLGVGWFKSTEPGPHARSPVLPGNPSCFLPSPADLGTR